MHPLLLIGVGGFAGAVLRYLVSTMIPPAQGFPVATLVINFAGSFVLGLVMYGWGGSLPAEVRSLVVVGFLGAFTTMSTFSYESYRLLERGESLLFAVNLGATVLLCVTAIHAAKAVAQLL